ncbi:chaperonin [Diatrype stigma]|uniref:Chaperonin n=1 Tax=Diatrype stigma TaxID=117547 RepID=A0AAN9UUE2_9PEZI
MARPRKVTKPTPSSTTSSHHKDDIRATSKAPPAKPKRGESAVNREEGWNYTSQPLTQVERHKNGLPRQFEKFLLHFVYELTYHNVSIPWDEACHRFHPGFSGNAMRQKLDRLRKELIAEGHLVPPDHANPLDENGEEFRGLVRANESPCDRDFTTVRVVKWEEPCLDRQRNLPDSKNFVHNRAAQAKAGTANIPKLVLAADDANEDKVEETETESDDETLVLRRPRRSARTLKRKYYKDTDSDEDEAKGDVAQKSSSTPMEFWGPFHGPCGNFLMFGSQGGHQYAIPLTPLDEFTTDQQGDPKGCDANPVASGLGEAEGIQEDVEEMDVPPTQFFEDALGAGEYEYDQRGCESDDHTSS